MYILSQGNDYVLGDDLSSWQRESLRSLNLITGREELSEDNQKWDWLRNPFPPADEKPSTFGVFRRLVNLDAGKFNISGSTFYALNQQQKAILSRIYADDFLRNNNPFIRHIIRRERRFLEETINPDTNQPYLKPINVLLYGEDDAESLPLTTHLYDAYALAEEFSQLLGQRVKSSGFIKTMLLRRVCSSVNAGLTTGYGMLKNWVNEEEDEDDYEESGIEFVSASNTPFKNLTSEEISVLERFVKILDSHQDKDPKYDLLKRILMENYVVEPWINRGCIIFSQYFDTIKWVCDRFANDFPDVTFGLYAGSDKSGIYEGGIYHRRSKEEIKKKVRQKELRLLFGTDAASEGLNLQSLGTLINLDLPWNPTRLEQRKGRIQRIGQEREEVFIYNMRYKDSVEDRVHSLLANRLKNIQDLFGQIPDTLEDVWVEVAMKKMDDAEKIINDISENDLHPFYNKYQNQANVKPINWEDCSLVLDNAEKRRVLNKGW